MALSIDEKREAYLRKVRAVEKERLAAQSGEEGTPTSPSYYSGGTIAVPSGNFAFPEVAFTYAELARYPKMVKDYENNSVKVASNISINTSLSSSGKILLPSGRRDSYSAGMCEYILEHGGIQSCGLYVPVDESRFTMNVRSDNPYGNWIRKDFAYYLGLLHDTVANKLKVKKIYISSAYRSPYYNYDLYSRMLAEHTAKKRVYWSPHMGGYAADLCATGNDLQTIISAAKALGFGGIGTGKTFVHVDIGPTGRFSYDY